MEVPSTTAVTVRTSPGAVIASATSVVDPTRARSSGANTSNVHPLGGLTPSVVPAVIPCRVAVMLVVPAASAVARPCPLMVATRSLPEAQLTEDVTFAVLPSENVPIAVNCCVPPALAEAKSGVTERPWSAVVPCEPCESPSLPPPQPASTASVIAVQIVSLRIQPPRISFFAQRVA